MSIDPKAASTHALASPRRGFGHHVVRLADLVMARAEAALAPLALTPLAYDTMICILDGSGMSQQELSRELNMYAPKMVGLIDGLEERGLVERKVNPADRRRHMLRLTPDGRELLERAAAIAAALEEELFGHFPEQDKARFKTLLERLEAAQENT